jgi:hypothetical protein
MSGSKLRKTLAKQLRGVAAELLDSADDAVEAAGGTVDSALSDATKEAQVVQKKMGNAVNVVSS